MARKRQEGISSSKRYRLKMFRVFGLGVPEEYAKDVAEALKEARDKGIGTYRDAWISVSNEVLRGKVPSAMWGLYKAFTNEYISKVCRRKEMTESELRNKWVENGLDDTVLNDIIEKVKPLVKEVPTSAQKVA